MFGGFFLLSLNVVLFGFVANQVNGAELGRCYWCKIPYNWGKKKDGFNYFRQDLWEGQCQTGTMQSPIALSEEIAIEINVTPLILNDYDKELPVTIKNNGHSATVTPSQSNNELSLAGGGLNNHYTFDHLHFHWQSEHTIDGYRYPLEMHLVHYASQYNNVTHASQYPEGIAVLAVMFDLSPDDYLDFQPLEKVIETLEDEVDVPRSLNNFKISDFFPRDTAGFYRYHGSLTTPGCNEVVVWTVFTNTIPISRRQLSVFHNMRNKEGKILYHTFRDIQPLNGRTVYLKISPIKTERTNQESLTDFICKLYPTFCSGYKSGYYNNYDPNYNNNYDPNYYNNYPYNNDDC